MTYGLTVAGTTTTTALASPPITRYTFFLTENPREPIVLTKLHHETIKNNVIEFQLQTLTCWARQSDSQTQ